MIFSNSKTSALYFIVIVYNIILSSCINRQDNIEYAEFSEKPCPPAVNIDSLKIVLRKQIREEERMSGYHSSYSDDGAGKSDFTFSENTPVYAAADTNSTVLALLPFCSEIRRIEGIKSLNAQGERWISVMHPEDVTKIGYLRDKDLADYMEKGYDSDYGFIVGASDTLMNEYRLRVIEIIRFSLDDHRILERYKTKYLASGYRFNRVINSTLSTSQHPDEGNFKALYVYETYRQSCPGGGMKEFILDNGSKLKQVTTVSSEGEGGFYNIEIAYIPLKFYNGKVLLVADADVQNIFNWEQADLRVFPYPGGSSIPIEDMVVIQYVSNGYDDPNIDSDTDPEKAKVITKNTIYQWNGNDLIKVKE